MFQKNIEKKIQKVGGKSNQNKYKTDLKLAYVFRKGA